MKGMADGAEKNAEAVRQSGLEMVKMLNKGRRHVGSGYEAEKYGLVLTDKNMDAVKKATEAHRQQEAAMQGLQVQIGTHRPADPDQVHDVRGGADPEGKLGGSTTISRLCRRSWRSSLAACWWSGSSRGGFGCVGCRCHPGGNAWPILAVRSLRFGPWWLA